MLTLWLCSAIATSTSSPGVSSHGCSRAADALGEQAVAQPPVADSQRLGAEHLHRGADDARAGEDDLGAIGLQSGDRAALRSRHRRVERDLTVDLGAAE